MIFIWYLAGLKSDSDVLVGVFIYLSPPLSSIMVLQTHHMFNIFFFPALRSLTNLRKEKGGRDCNGEQ